MKMHVAGGKVPALVTSPPAPTETSSDCAFYPAYTQPLGNAFERRNFFQQALVQEGTADADYGATPASHCGAP